MLFSWLIVLALMLACTSAPRNVTPVMPAPTTAAPSPVATVVSPTARPAASPTTGVPSQEPPPAPTPAAAEQGKGLNEGAIAFYSDRDGNPEIYVMTAGGSGPARLTNDPGFDDSPSLSPDGQKIAFLTSRHDPHPQFPNLKYELYVMAVDGSDTLRLTTTDAAEGHPAWSPDSQKILFDADYDGDGFYEIYVMNADGTGVTRLTASAANDQFADWSPDGTRIAFSSDRNGNWDLFVMDADGGNQQALTSSPDWELFPAWSPDGHQIAFNGLQPRSRNTDIFVMNADGSQVRRLTDTPRFDENPTWSPDGRQIAFQTQRDGDFEIYVMNDDGSEQHALAAHAGDELWPSWSRAADHTARAMLFEKSEQTFASVPTWKIALEDLDGDGDLDAVFANAQANSSEVWLNDGSGAFIDTEQQLGAYGHGVDVGDVDGDGDPDVIISPHNATASKIYLNDGHGTFHERKDAFHGDIGYSVELLDIDGDGDLDAVGENAGASQAYVNDGTGAFAPRGVSLPQATVWGDLDSDGDVDLFAKEEGVGYSVQLNDGAGNFSPHWNLPDMAAMLLGDMATGDVDGDGDLDVAVTNGHFQTRSEPALIFVNDGAGRFTDSGQRLAAVRNAGISLGDLDGDGDLDLALTDYMEPCQIWLNNGSGQFADSGFRFGDDQFYRHTYLGDLDGDGDLDIFLATFGMDGGPNEIWFNQ